MYPKRSLFLLALILFFTAGSYAQTVKLVLVKGEKYEQTSITAVKSVSSIMGQEMESTANTTTVEIFEIKNVSATEINLTTTIKRMIVNSTGMGQEMNFDSDKKDNTGPGAEELAKMVGKIKNVTIDGSGKVIKEDKEESNPVNPMGTGKSGISIINAEFIGKQIKAGMSWPSTVSVDTGAIKTNTTGTYTIQSVNDQTHIAAIEFKGTTTLTGTMEQMGQEMDIKSTNKVTGQLQVDLNTGIILENNTTTTGNMTIETSGMSIPIVLNNTVTTKVKKL